MYQLLPWNGINRLLKLGLFLLVLALDHDGRCPASGFPATESSLHHNQDARHNSAEETRSWLISQIDTVANSLQTCVQYPGMSLAVIRLGKTDQETVLFTRNYGVMDIESKRPVDDDTRFCIGSVTKGFTAALLVQMLHENGSYTLDTPVQNILGPDFKLNTPELTGKSTIRDILAHRVGVAKHFGAFLMGYNMSRPEIVRRVRHLPVSKPFRASRVYNNFMYVVAGQLAEKLNGSWWESQIVAKFLKNLKMDKTTFADRVADWSTHFALPHALDNGQLITLRAKVTGNILRPLGPAGSICTTAKDMAEWLLMHLRNGTNRNDKPVLDPGVIENLFQIHNNFPKPMGFGKDSPDVESLALGYGLGWVVGKYRGTKRLFHSGFANYYYSMVSVLPEKNIAIFTALNGPHLVKCDNGMKALHFYIADLLLEEKPWINASTICSYPRQWLQKDTKQRLPADKKPKVGQTTTPWSMASDKADSLTYAFTDIGSSTDSYSTEFADNTAMTASTWSSGWSSDATSTTLENADDFTQSESSFGALLTKLPESGISGNDSRVVLSTTPRITASETNSTERNTNPPRRRTLKFKKRLKSTTGFLETTTDLVTSVTSPFIRDLDCPSDACRSQSASTESQTDAATTTKIESSSASGFTNSNLAKLDASASPESAENSTFGSRLRPGKRPLRRRRPKRNAGIMTYFKKYEGRYSNPFFGDLVISINRTVLALQLNYGYYGKALLQPNSDDNNDIFRMRFFNSIWYQSESDDMKLFAKLGMFDVQFGRSKIDGGFDKIVVFLFDTENPPVFTR